MKIRICILILLLACTAYGKTPIDYKKWQIDDKTFQKKIGGAVANYPTANAWAAIENDFEIEGDSVVFVNKSVLKARVNKNGVSTVTLPWQGVEYSITQKMLGIGWIKISTRQSQWIDSTMEWSNFSVDSNIGTWTGISPGVDYRVLKDNGRVAHGVFYKKAFLDSAVVLYNQREDSLDIALANVMVYTLSANIDDADVPIGDVAKRRLKDFGYYSFNLTDQRLNFPGSDTLPRIPVRQYWERRGTKIICIEYVMMRRIKQVHEAYPNAVIWHNDVKKIEGTTNVEDASIYSGSADNNYGASVNFIIRYDDYYGLIRAKNVASELGAGATISAAVCSLYVWSNSQTKDISAYRIFKPWEEGTQDNAVCSSPGCSWNDWACTGSEWGTEGCLCARDNGVENSNDDGACTDANADRKATAEDTKSVGATGWVVFDVTTLGQGWYGETISEYGILVKCDATGYAYCRSTEYGSGNNPYFHFTYTTDGEEAIPARRRRIMERF